MGIPSDKIVNQPVKMSSFKGNVFAIGFINLDMTIRPLRAANSFHIMDAQTSYHLPLKKPWIHKHKAVLSTYHQFLKAIWKGKKFYANTSKCLFQQNENPLFKDSFLWRASWEWRDYPSSTLRCVSTCMGGPQGAKIKARRVFLQSSCPLRPLNQLKVDEKKKYHHGENLF